MAASRMPLAQDDPDDLAARCSQGGPDSEFMGPPGDRIRHDAVDPDGGQQQGGGREDHEQPHGEAAPGEESGGDPLHRSDGVDGLILGWTGDPRAHGGDQAEGFGRVDAAVAVYPNLLVSTNDASLNITVFNGFQCAFGRALPGDRPDLVELRDGPCGGLLRVCLLDVSR